MAEDKNQPGGFSNEDLQKLFMAMIQAGSMKNLEHKDNKDSAKRMAQAIWNDYNAFLEVGFNEYEAFDLTKVFLESINK